MIAYKPLKKDATSMEIFQYSLRAIWVYGPGVFTVLLSYFMLINLSQGQDVVMQAGEEVASGLFALLSILAWAYFIWYSSRLIGYQKKFNDDDWPLPVISTFPRLLAYNAFVSVQAAILALPTIEDFSFSKVFMYIVAHNIYFFFVSYLLYARRGKWINISAIIIGMVYALWLISLAIKGGNSTHQTMLPWEALLLFGLQITSLYYFNNRRTRVNTQAPDKLDLNARETLRFLNLFSTKIISVPAWFKDQEQHTFNTFNSIALGAILLDILAFSSLRVADAMSPLAVILLALGIFAGITNLLSYVSIHLKINIFFLLLLIALVVGKVYPEHYAVQLSEANKPDTFIDRPTLAEFFDRWITERKSEIDNASASKGFPLYFVLADGGASRSGYWVGSVLSAWQDQSAQNNQQLSRHLFCLSGASGGSVGNATFYSLLRYNQAGGPLLPSTQKFLKRDFLSHSIAHYLGPDIAKHIIPVLSSHDRAAAISETMNYWASDDLFDAMGKNIDEVFDYSGKLPVLAINVTRVQGGIPSVISSVKLEGFSKRLDILDTISGLCGEPKTITLSTAAVLGARFPYISPAGKIGDEYFVDGGYFDNSGSGIVHEMLFYLDSLKSARVRSDTSLAKFYGKLRFHIVHISNTPDEKEIELIHPLANDLMAPLLTVFSTYNSQTEVNDQRTEQFVHQLGGKATSINLFREGENESYPMNWVISKFRLKLMNEQLDRVRQNEIQKLISDQ